MDSKISVLYIVSTLKKSGPTNQLFSLIKYIDRDLFEPFLLTLSPESKDSKWVDFQGLGVKISSLKLSRLDGFLRGKRKVEAYIDNLSPKIVHSQGIRADIIMSNSRYIDRWFSTSHNNPYLDYSMKFNFFQSKFMTNSHIRAFANCSNLISCSKTIAQQLEKLNLVTKPIPNGVDLSGIDSFSPIPINEFERPIFISVGSLIKRKNMNYLINAFNQFSQKNKGTLIILGTGPEMSKLKNKVRVPDRVFFGGNVDNVPAYLLASDFFISSSLAEGLPYTVIEALAAHLPAILSNIPSHQEIQNEIKDACILFDVNKGPTALKDIMVDISKRDITQLKACARKGVENYFSAKVMSNKYQNEYKNFIERYNGMIAV